LDALCRRFKIDLSNREKHGALVDCELLAAVYLEMRGGRQQGLSGLNEKGDAYEGSHVRSIEDLLAYYKDRPFREPRSFCLSDEEKESHESFTKAKILKQEAF
jgi:DNA polymerase-3 subunit epsilon